MSDLRYWIALHSLPEIGPVVARRLLSAFGSPEYIFQAPSSELKQIEGIGKNRLGRITGFDEWDAVEKEIDSAEKQNISMITLHDPAYPGGLRTVYDAPILLYVKGKITDSDKYAIAMVGSRTASRYGLEVAEKMGYSLAASGLTVVSGMARGIDTAAHTGALKAGGRTIAVLGSGLDVPYPASNRGLMKEIESSGAVISEFPLGMPPNRENFPKRNRIISGLTYGTVVVEAALDSGSLITVGYALEQGREVFAVPGNITSRSSRGTNDLIRKGAKLVESAKEVMAELSLQLKGVLREDRLPDEKKLPDMTDDERSLYSLLSSDPLHIDSITRKMNIQTARALSLLLNLELKGVVRQAGGKHFSLNSNNADIEKLIN